MIEKSQRNKNYLVDYSAKIYLFPLLFIGLVLRSVDSLFIKFKFKY